MFCRRGAAPLTTVKPDWINRRRESHRRAWASIKPLRPVTASVLLVPLLLALVFAPWPLLAAEPQCRIDEPARVLAPARSEEISIATQNLWRLSAAEQAPPLVAQRLRRWAEHVDSVLGLPHVLVLQEVDSDALLQRLVEQIVARGGPRYESWLIEGQPPAAMDVAVLTRAPVQVAEVRALFASERHGQHWLFSRAPLRLVLAEPLPMVLLALHLRSGRGLRHPERGTWVQAKRRAQAEALRQQVLTELTAGRQVLVAGDFNSAPVDQGGERYAEPWSILARPPLFSAWQQLPPAEHFSYRYRCQVQAIDHLLLSPGLAERLSRVAVSRGHAGRYDALYGGAGAGRVLSDHDALKIYLRVPSAKSQTGEQQ